MLTFRDLGTGETMTINHVSGAVEPMSETIKALAEVHRRANFERMVAHEVVCPACEGQDHGQDHYLLAFRCDCPCHG